MMESAATLLSKYIQIDTSTTSGNEKSGLLYMQMVAESFGLYTYYHETTVTKGNLIIALHKEDLLPFYNEVYIKNYRKKGTPFSKEVMVLLSHVDVVDANADDWRYPPYSGEIIEGEIWGRGAIDAKQIGITHLLTMRNLKEMDSPISIIQVITSEEEYGSENGLKRLLSDYPFLWKGVTVWNEGGGFPIQVGDTFFYLVETGQKGNMSFTVTIPQKKSSNPYLPSNQTDIAAFRMVQALHTMKVENESIPASVSKMFSLMVKGMKSDASFDRYDDLIATLPEEHRRMFSAMTKTTFTVTAVHGGKRHPKLKGSYQLSVDVRPLPITKLADVKRVVEQTITDIEPEAIIDWVYESEGYDRELPESMRRILERQLQLGNVETAIVVPFMTIGSNDGKYFNDVQATVLGYCPMTTNMTFDRVLPLVHGVDERIGIVELEFGIQQLTAVFKNIIEESMEGEMSYER
ncbi:M20/M25/M40 family metallo-hydrolase [Sporosarcina oncorhynchi]|uniref:M20/M25/M40 family metallo-hydrolase n=1 Tax=Sporosarcina oncorhynchi TaxID=3056444 RepID=A0ABZ0L6E3_9BACL|nr:M20/M25/M40 family metallo-hydrolase [Sporosarcina sp. T2O-4]WOV88065.1 M20/M25/M40 family metallo-hydrolase [Sporosarcina sp. T2O-4]